MDGISAAIAACTPLINLINAVATTTPAAMPETVAHVAGSSVLRLDTNTAVENLIAASAIRSVHHVVAMAITEFRPKPHQRPSRFRALMVPLAVAPSIPMPRRRITTTKSDWITIQTDSLKRAALAALLPSATRSFCGKWVWQSQCPFTTRQRLYANRVRLFIIV